MKKLSLIVLSFMLIFIAGITTVYAAAIYDHKVTFDMNGGDYIHHDVSDFGSKLAVASEPLTILNLGDSTSNEDDEWFYLSSDILGNFLQDYTVMYRLWDSTTSTFKTKSTIQYGTDGDAYAEFDGSYDQYLSAMDSDDLSITGDIDLRAKIDFDAGEDGYVIAKWPGTGNSYFLKYAENISGVSGVMTFYWGDGGSGGNATSSAFTVPADSPIWIRATLDVDNGASGYTTTFYYSLDGITYTSINAVTAGTGPTSIYNNTADVRIGQRSDLPTDVFSGKIYEVEIRDGIDGAIVASANMDQAFPSTITSFKDVEGNIWNINGDVSVGNGAPGLLFLNASINGATIGTFNTTVLNAMINTDIDLSFINLGHNETTDVGYEVRLEQFLNSLQYYADGSAVVLLTQNPKISPVTDAVILKHNIVMDKVLLLAAEQNYAVIDTKSVLDIDTATYTEADGIHPSADGSLVWADQVCDMIKYGIDGGGYSEITYLVEDGNLINEPDAPTKDGVEFIGWYTNEALTDEWNFDTDLVQNDMTLYAKYSDSTTGGVAVISISSTPLEFLGIAWYFWAIGIAGVYYFGFTKKGRKSIGFKK